MKLTPLFSYPFACFIFVAAAMAALAATPAATTDAEGFVPLFNGRDLTGWTNINCAPETWGVRDGMIVCTGKPTGALRTARQYENFILEVEWRHLESGGNSGVFIWGSPISAPGVPFLRGIEVQVLDEGYAKEFERKNGKKSESFTAHGDVFPIHGATMKPIGRTNGRRSFPSEDRSKPSPQWNHYRIVANSGSLRLSVNGKEVSGGDDCNYRQGYLALESEGAPVEFRNLRIKELPSSGASAEVTAPLDPGWRLLFNGLDLRGWRTSEATATRWAVERERLTLRPAVQNADAVAAALWTAAEFGDTEFVVDFQAARAAAGAAAPSATVLVRGNGGRGTPVVLSASAAGRYSRFVITVRGRTVRVQRDAEPATETALPAGAPARGALGFFADSSAGVFMNLHVRDL